VALGGSPGSKAIQHLFSFAFEAAGEGMEAQFYCLISALFSCLGEPSGLEGILISIFQTILNYQKKQSVL
jgi:hypothetical protein